MNAMTLEQVRDWHRHQLNFLPESGVPTDLHQNAADAIDAHLAQTAKAVDGWRPIETAPKDGRSLILCRQTAFVGSWDADERAWCDNRRSLRDPSHWMPLPASPAPDKEGQP